MRVCIYICVSLYDYNFNSLLLFSCSHLLVHMFTCSHKSSSRQHIRHNIQPTKTAHTVSKLLSRLSMIENCYDTTQDKHGNETDEIVSHSSGELSSKNPRTTFAGKTSTSKFSSLHVPRRINPIFSYGKRLLLDRITLSEDVKRRNNRSG